jgi:hypothetical protein
MDNIQTTLSHDDAGVHVVNNKGVTLHTVSWDVLHRWLYVDYRQLENIKRNSSWVEGFILRTARVEMHHSFEGPKLSLVVGGSKYDERYSVKLSHEQAAELICRELPDEAKSFYIADMRIREVPKQQEDWARYGEIGPRSGTGFRYTVFDTRQEAEAALVEMLQDLINDVRKNAKGVTITLNGTPHVLENALVTYDVIRRLLGHSDDDVAHPLYSVTYANAANPFAGILAPGDAGVVVMPGTRFEATVTGNA